jgi:hypothetical protein
MNFGKHWVIVDDIQHKKLRTFAFEYDKVVFWFKTMYFVNTLLIINWIHVVCDKAENFDVQQIINCLRGLAHDFSKITNSLRISLKFGWEEPIRPFILGVRWQMD